MKQSEIMFLNYQLLIYNPAKDKVEESLWKEEKQRSN
jgi:hypothetical protein